MKLITFLSLTAVGLAACGGQDAAAPEAAAPGEPVSSGQSVHDMSSHRAQTGEGIAHGEGRVVSVDPAGRRIELDHGPLAGAGMEAMTMTFGTVGDVDLTSVAAGDEVMFMVKQGRDGSWRVTGLCAPDSADDCMTTMND